MLDLVLVNHSWNNQESIKVFSLHHRFGDFLALILAKNNHRDLK